MIKKWNQFNESKAEKPGGNVTGSAKINLSDEDVNAFTDNPSLQKLISDDKVALLGNEAWYWEDDMATKGVMDQYLEIPGKVEEEPVTESKKTKKPTKSSSFDEKHDWLYKNVPEYKKVCDEAIDKFLKETKKK